MRDGNDQVGALRLHLGDVLLGQLLDAIGVDDAVEPALVPVEDLRRRERDDATLIGASAVLPSAVVTFSERSSTT